MNSKSEPPPKRSGNGEIVTEHEPDQVQIGAGEPLGARDDGKPLDGTRLSGLAPADTYREAGQMVRHFSTARGTIVTIALPLAFVTFGWILGHLDDPVLVTAALIIEAVLFIAGVLASMNLSLRLIALRGSLMDMELGDQSKPHNLLQTYSVLASPTPDIYDWFLIVVGTVIHVALWMYLGIHYFL